MNELIIPINSRKLSAITTDNQRVDYDRQKNYLFDLPYLSILEFHGERASEFLQGQLTCDLRTLSDIQMIQGAQCNLKGRIMSLLDVINWQGIKAIIPSDISEVTRLSLEKTAQLSRVSIKENNEFKLYGFYLQNPHDILPAVSFLPSALYALAPNEHFCYYHLGNGFYIFIVRTDCHPQFYQLFKDNEQVLGSLDWHSLRLMQGQITIYPESRGLFLPHRLDLHHTSYLSFDKGCYKGQEIIARTHYKATIKHELKLYTATLTHTPYSGQKLFKELETIEVGELIDYTLLDNSNYLIAVSMLKNAENRVYFQQQTQPVQLMPYSLLTDN